MVSKGGNQVAGGYGSRQHVETSVRTGSGSRSARPGGVGQLGNKQGNHVTSTVNRTPARRSQLPASEIWQRGRS
jgi:hypothetical protein